MNTANILCLLCGSLIASLFFFIVFVRQSIMDEKLIRHIRAAAHRDGYRAGIESVIGKK